MESKDLNSELKELKDKINYYSKMYYDEDNSPITDYEFDKMMNRLKQIEKEHPELITKDSPTQHVGGHVSSSFTKVTHEVPLQSLQDIFDFSELREFDEKIKKVGKTNYCVETKIDGLSCALKYENGILVKGATRGDGNIGEDVTENVKVIKSIPHKLKDKLNIIVRGEVFMSKKDFENLNEEQEVLGKPLFANARNAAAGSLRQLDYKITQKRNLDIYIFNVQKLEGNTFNSHYEQLKFLETQGFNVIPYKKLCKNIDEAIEAVKDIGNKRPNLTFGIDGAVVKVDNLDLREKLGETAKVPRWAIAYKYPPEEKDAIIEKVVFQVGRTGAITPVAEFKKPVLVAGSMISRVTLHNEDFINEKDIRIKDHVIIQKQGDVIPEVTKVLTDKRTGNEEKIVMPTKCPVCGAKTEREEDGIILRCTGSECPAKLLLNIVNFVSRNAMNINGLGYEIIKKLIDLGKVKNIADLYYLTKDDVGVLYKIGKDGKMANNLIDSIEKSKSNDLSKLIAGFGIRDVGPKLSKDLAKKYKTLDNLEKAKIKDLAGKYDIGEKVATNIYEFFHQDQTKDLIKRLKKAGVNTKYIEKEVTDDRFKNQIFCVTGTLNKYSRTQAREIIENFGGEFTNTLNKKVNYLVAGENAGSKLEKAKKYGIKILTEEEFEKMIK